MLPILYSFRRCPYAMRARLAIEVANVACELREVVLRDKAPEFLEASPSATVPCLVEDGESMDESFDIMIWALKQRDPGGWLNMPEEGFALIDAADGPFKQALDRYKYASRYDDVDASEEQQRGSAFIAQLNDMLADGGYLYGNKPTLADMAILPFIRQFAHVDLEWFEDQPWPYALDWLNRFKSSDRFQKIMKKYPRWNAGDAVVHFP